MITLPLFDGKNRFRVIQLNYTELVLVDYSYLKEREMIDLTDYHRLWAKGKHNTSFIANYIGTYGTPAYMKAAYQFTEETKSSVIRGAFLGINGPKVALLKGIVYFMNVNFKAFDSEEEALTFVTEKTKD
ncbi:MAG: hypothetical protein ACK57K_05225 [Chryseotalea sp.]